MSLLAPWMLLVAAAAAVPLLLHLLRRRIGTRVEFPAVRYLARAEQEHSRTLRLRNLALMALRVAAVVLIALAAAHPVARFFGGGHGPTALAVVLDNSLSTTVVERGHPLSTRLDALADRAFAAAQRTDRLWLVTADGVVRSGDAATLRDAVQQVSSLGGAGDPEAAVARATALVRAAGLPARQVALVTDGQQTTWRSALHTDSVSVVAWIPDSAVPANRAVIAVTVAPARWTPSGMVSAQVQSPDSAAYRIALDGRTLARGAAAPGASIQVRAAPRARGWLAGTVELDPDELPGDNVRHFAAWVGPPPQVQVTPGAGPFVASALDVLRADGRVATGAAVHVVAADELAALPALIVAPSDPVRMGAANRALARAGVPWQFGQARRGAVTVDGAGLGSAGVTLRYSLRATGAAPSDTLARTGVEPWIVAGAGYVLVASPLDPAATSLPVSAAFVPWLAGLLSDRLSGSAGRAIPAWPGQRLTWPEWADGLAGAAVDSASSQEELPAAGDAGAEFTAPGRTGTWFFTRGGARVGALVVNARARESALARWSRADFARLLGARARVVDDDSQWESAVFAGSTRGSLLVPLLVALLAVLVIEGVLTSRGTRREARS
ncbi:MAG TPA: VWA domain-containing protein [Gemmatimonadaceae bacterium]|nr:VWA domain-containing protein [Gemmatimonadaceae bacterium]